MIPASNVVVLVHVEEMIEKGLVVTATAHFEMFS